MKKKILLIIICLLLIAQNVAGYISNLPPGGDWQQGYWDATAGSHATIWYDSMGFTINGGAGDGDEIYYVLRNATDLRNISYISVYWAMGFGAVPGAGVFGIGTVQGDNAFTANVTRTTNIYTRSWYDLDVTDYNGDYYIKIGGYLSSVGVADDLLIVLSEIRMYNYSASFPKNATSVQETTATLNGYLTEDSDTNCTCGFWVSNVTNPNASNYQFNFSAGSSCTQGSFSASATGLTSGEYYYVRTWSTNGHTLNYSSNQTYFLTKPNAPTSFSISAVHPRSIDLQWTNATLPPGMVNHSVIIHYSTSSPPGAPKPGTWGTFGDNVSDSDRTTITGLAEDTTYYFVAWTYLNNSGSPSMGWISTGFATTSGATEGGFYNISVRYENESVSGNCVVNLSHWRIHEFLIHSGTGTDFVRFDNGIHTSSLEGTFVNNASGNFTVEINSTITYIEFHWNSSVSALKHCYRVQVLDAGQRNVTFYIRTDLPVYGEGTTKEFHTDSAPVVNPAADLTISTTYPMNEVYGVYVYNISVYPMWETVPTSNYTVGTNQITIDNAILNVNTTMCKVEYYTHKTVSGVTGPLDNTLVKYTYYFKDETIAGYFGSPSFLNEWAEIYVYNSTGTKLSIHKEYWSSEEKVYPWLIYNKKYRIGVGNNKITLPLIGQPPTGSETSPDPIVISDPGITSYGFFDVIDFDIGWESNGIGFWVYYQDTLYQTRSVTFRVWDVNGTMVYNDTSDQDYKNFTYAGAWHLYLYNWTITTNHTAWGYINQTVGADMWKGVVPLTDITSLNDLLNRTLGYTPFVSYDPATEGQEVSWTYVLVFVIGFIITCSFGAYNAYVGTLAVGLWLSFSGAYITGVALLVFVPVGIFLITMTIIFAMGGKYR